MRAMGKTVVLLLAVVWVSSGCGAPQIDFSKIERPERAPEMVAYDVFVGEWDWQAELLNTEGPGKKWTGQAQWNWALDRRCLHGVMRAESSEAAFEAAGIWSWHPAKKTYIWWMFNNWGYPQEGTARYDEATRTWTMPYTSVGLDGTTSYGQYVMKVVDHNTLEWRVDEWADMTRMFKKMEMTGTYKRRQ